MKIVLTRSMLPSDIEYIKNGLDKEIAGKYDFTVPADFSEETIAAEAADSDVLLGPYVTETILTAAKKLRLIQVPWTGMDTFNFEAVRNTDVPVCNTHSNADSVAEMCLAIVLDLVKKISYHDRKMRAGSWNRDQKPLDLKAGMLNAKKAVILGYGNIGSRIGRLLAAFGTRIAAVDSRAAASDIVSEVFANEEMKTALADADIVVSTLPLTDATRGLLGAELIGSMKNGAILVNMSRAAVVDEDALWDALSEGRIAGFGSDVWWTTPKRGESQSWPSAKHAFTELDNVVLSPHRAGFVENSFPHLDGAVRNLIALEKGEPLADIVDKKAGF